MIEKQTSAPVVPGPTRPRTFPAGAHALIHLRDAGHHPRLVVVVVGRTYRTRPYVPLAARLGAPAPLMALADEIEARSLSWAVLRGLGAVLCNARGAALPPPLLLEAIAQIAREAAPVALFRGGDLNDPDSLADDATDLLFDARFDRADGAWPAGFSAEAMRDYEARSDAWAREGAP